MAPYGAGVYLYNSSAEFDATNITNQASVVGGGILAIISSLQFNNCMSWSKSEGAFLTSFAGNFQMDGPHAVTQLLFTQPPPSNVTNSFQDGVMVDSIRCNSSSGNPFLSICSMCDLLSLTIVSVDMKEYICRWAPLWNL